MRYIISIASIIIVSLQLICCSCRKDEPPITTTNRTIIVYMLADNNLGSVYHFDNENIKSMLNAFTDNEIDGRLLIFHSDRNAHPSLYEIIQNKDKTATDTLLVDYTGCISTDTATMRQVITDAQRIAPADSYGIIFWSHATGWLPQNRYYAPQYNNNTTSLGREGKEEHTIDIDKIGKALSPFHFNFILFDACLMSSIEVAYELKSVCDYIIASPTETMGAGYPYEEIIPMLYENNIDYNAVCQEYYNRYIAPTDWDGTIALIKTSALEQLADVCREIVYSNNTTTYSHTGIQYYDRKTPHVFFDLEHFMSQMATDEQKVLLKNALNEAVIYKAADDKFLGLIINNYCGLSCYIPGCADEITEEYYSQLKWYNRIYK